MQPAQRIYWIGGGVLAVIVLLLGLIIWISANQNANAPAEPERVRELVTIAYEEQIIEDGNLFADDRPIRVQVGIPGTIEETYEVTRDAQGNELEKKLIETKTQVEKQDRIMRQGTLDRAATEQKIRATVLSVFDSLEKLDFSKLYSNLAAEDRMNYTEEQLKYAADEIGFDLETYSITGDLSYQYPKYLSDLDATLSPIQDVAVGKDGVKEGQQNLMAILPISMTFGSSVLGSQGVEFQLRLVLENGDWFIRYFGPTETLTINQTRSQADGGKVFGKPVGATVKLNRAVLFPFLNRLYFDYELTNTSERNTILPPRGEEIFRPTDAFISSVSLYDEPATPYVLQENILFQQGEDTVWIEKTGVGRLIYSPTPGLEINRIFLSMQLTITDAARFETEEMAEREATTFVAKMDFGEIALTRQNRQADYGRENAIRNEDELRKADAETTPAPISIPATTP